MKKGKLLSSLALSCAIMLSFSSSASAVSVYLTISDTSVTSASIGLQTAASYTATNSTTSVNGVYAIINKAQAGKGWVTAGETLMPIGQSANGKYIDGGNVNWNIELNPNGWGTAYCTASGSIW